MNSEKFQRKIELLYLKAQLKKSKVRDQQIRRNEEAGRRALLKESELFKKSVSLVKREVENAAWRGDTSVAIPREDIRFTQRLLDYFPMFLFNPAGAFIRVDFLKNENPVELK